MKRFLVFAGQSYYPEGGMDDFVGDYETLGAAEATAREKLLGTPGKWDDADWAHVYDTKNRKRIAVKTLGGIT